MTDYYWKHFCKAERGYLYVADKEPCNWCDEPQSGPLTRIYKDSQGRNVKVTVDFHDEINHSPLENIKVL